MGPIRVDSPIALSWAAGRALCALCEQGWFAEAALRMQALSREAAQKLPPLKTPIPRLDLGVFGKLGLILYPRKNIFEADWAPILLVVTHN